MLLFLGKSSSNEYTNAKSPLWRDSRVCVLIIVVVVFPCLLFVIAAAAILAYDALTRVVFHSRRRRLKKHASAVGRLVTDANSKFIKQYHIYTLRLRQSIQRLAIVRGPIAFEFDKLKRRDLTTPMARQFVYLLADCLSGRPGASAPSALARR